MSDSGEFDDVEWEEDASEEVDGNDQQAVSGHADAGSTLDLVITTGPQKAATKSKTAATKRVVFTEQDYEQVVERHQLSVSELMDDALSIARSCFSPEVAHAIRGIVPDEVLKSGYPGNDQDAVATIARWMKQTFNTLPVTSVTSDEGGDGSNSTDLIRFVLKNKAGTCHQLNQLFIALLHALGHTVRYVRTIDGVGFLPSDHPDLYEERWTEANAGREFPAKLRKQAPRPALLSWAEVYIPDSVRASSSVNSTMGRVAPLPPKSHASHSVVVDLTEEEDDEVVFIPTPACAPSSSSSSSSSSNSAAPMHSARAAVTPPRAPGRWLHVDLHHGRLDQPHCIAQELRKGKPLQYVLGFELAPSDIGDDEVNSADAAVRTVVNLTSAYNQCYRYATGREKDTRARLEVWMEQVIAGTNTSVRGVVDLTGAASNSSCNARTPGKRPKLTHSSSSNNYASAEDLSVRHPLPTRMCDFKDHPVYLLERHLLAEQALHPSCRAVGAFKGENVYLQVHKEVLRTKLQWRRQLRQVRRDEAAVRVIQRRVFSHKPGDGGGAGGQGGEGGGGGAGGGEAATTIELRLFGSWQTEHIQIEPVVEGILPINKFGNIEVWEGNQAFVPKGAAFVDDPAAIKAAQSLGLPCAPAVVGFERRGLHTVPIIGGVVVLRQHVGVVKDASYFVSAVKEENSYHKRDKEITARWERLAFGMLSRERLREKYGH